VPEARLRHDVPEARLRHDVPEARLRHDVPEARLRHDVPEARLRHDNPALGDLNRHLDLRFVSGFARPCGHDRRAVMRGHVGAGPVHGRFMEAGLGHAGLRVHCPRTNGGQ